MAHRAQPVPDSALFTWGPPRTYRDRNLLQIAMPLGGIGAGCVCLNGQGGLQDFSIRHTPTLSALQDGHQSLDSAFAVLHLPDLGITRLVEGSVPVERVYDQGLKGQGFRGGGHEGLPRFRVTSFRGEFPFGTVDLSDTQIPLQVSVTGFNPFIPLDDRNSSIPCAILEYRLTNSSSQPVVYEFSYHLSHLAPGTDDSRTSRNEVIPGSGAFLTNTENELSDIFGSCALGVVGAAPQIKAMWFRGGWFDGISALWKELSTGSFSANDGVQENPARGRNGASILLKGSLEPGGSVTYPIVIAWHFPNVHWDAGRSAEACCDLDCGCDPDAPKWRPYYAGQWKDAREVFLHVRDRYASLRARTKSFHDALFRSTLPDYVLEAVSANLAIIKSPTVLRQEDGNLWAWEGCFASSGCCPGSCTHVWNYAQAIPHLFPSLERTLREQELLRSMDERGHVAFRAALPDGPVAHDYHSASDGQLGGILKLHREWEISGDTEWLRSMYPAAKRSIDFCIQHWDPDHTGTLTEPHHNTYDIEFWGPDGMCTSFYLGALAAIAIMADEVGSEGDARLYRELEMRGASKLNGELFNGEYYEQKVMVEGLRAAPSKADLEELARSNPDEHALLLKEGPKYQYGIGCISDGVFGSWLAKVCGVRTSQNRANVRPSLQSIFAYNFRESLWDHANLQRPGYAMGDEPGLLLCSWPRGGKPTLPFVYSDEVWTGIEYQVASHMISEGLVREGLTIVKAVRSRHDGLSRNPWNEYECGNYYARAMASYGLLAACSGFRYSALTRTLYLNPQTGLAPSGKSFECFFSTASGWGTVVVDGEDVQIRLEEGSLDVRRFVLAGPEMTNLSAQSSDSCA